MLVYIAEAHARDEWPVGDSISFCDAPTTLAARVALVQELARTSVGACLRRWPAGSVLVDGMRDEFLYGFAAWPVRFFVLQPQSGGSDELELELRVALKSQPHDDDCMYHASDLEAWLEQHQSEPHH